MHSSFYLRRDLKLASEEVKERAYFYTWLDMPLQYGAHGLNRILLPSKRSRDVLLDLSNVTIVTQAVPQN